MRRPTNVFHSFGLCYRRALTFVACFKMQIQLICILTKIKPSFLSASLPPVFATHSDLATQGCLVGTRPGRSVAFFSRIKNTSGNYLLALE